MNLEHLVDTSTIYLGADLSNVPWTEIDYEWSIDSTQPLLYVEVSFTVPTDPLS